MNAPSSAPAPSILSVAPALLAFLLGACVTTEADGLGDLGRSYGEPVAGVGSTSGTPSSWSELERIETWLSSPEAHASPEDVPAAELTLAQGRLDLTRGEGTALPPAVLRLRLDLAKAGFQRVLAHPDATALERDRARDGLARVADLRSSGAIASPSGGTSGSTPPILSRATWGAGAPKPGLLRSNRRPWTKITVHHSAMSSSGMAGASTGPSRAAIRRIQDAHMGKEGWGDIGYHFLIDPAGRVYQGRSLAYQGAHAGGSNNVGNIGVCLLGDFDARPPDPRALASLEKLLGALSRRHGIARSSVKGHREFKATQCPGDRLMDWVHGYARGRRLAYENARAPAPRTAQ